MFEFPILTLSACHTEYTFCDTESECQMHRSASVSVVVFERISRYILIAGSFIVKRKLTISQVKVNQT